MFKINDYAYIITNGRYVEKVLIIKSGGGFYIVKFSNGAGTRIRESRLYHTEEEAKASINKK